MKYISTLIFIVALAWSWCLVNKKNPIDFETHASIQTKLVEVIRQAVKEIKPNSNNIEILDISTATVDDYTVKAFFKYKFDEADTESGEQSTQTIDGEALLRRNKGVDPNADHWTMEKVTTNTGEVTFKNGLIISPLAAPGEDGATKPPPTMKPETSEPAPVGTPNPESTYE